MADQIPVEDRQRMMAADAADRVEYWMNEQAKEPPSQFRSDLERLIRFARPIAER